ncbi:MAG: V-type ATP synthase subunit D [bacterium]|nr:V-type ATP synthase subunit D [bacterium]
MARYAIPPTKSNLLETRAGLAFAREGRELLSRKRDILVAELLGLAASAAAAQRRLEEALAAAYAALGEALRASGLRAVGEASRAVASVIETEIGERKVMGVPLPEVRSSVSGAPPFYAPRPVSFWVDEAQRRFAALVGLLDAAAETRAGVHRLAREVRKTVRRVNALEKIYIPDYEETLHYIGDALEESDREAFFVLRLVKERLRRNR